MERSQASSSCLCVSVHVPSLVRVGEMLKSRLGGGGGGNRLCLPPAVTGAGAARSQAITPTATNLPGTTSRTLRPRGAGGGNQ